LGECGELVAFKDGKPFVPPSAADGRTIWKCHDRLPWLAAATDKTSSGLLTACVEASTYNMQPGFNMPDHPHEIRFAHKGSLGWKNTVGGGFTGHFANTVENAARLSDRNPRAHEVWNGWLALMRAYLTKNPNAVVGQGLGEAREAHSHLVHAWLAWTKTGDPFWREDATRTADLLMSKPLSEHGSTKLNDPQWPYTLWMVKGDAAREWLLEAARWFYSVSWDAASVSGWTLGVIGYWLTGDTRIFRHIGQSLVTWRDAFYRAPGTELDWVGRCPGRTGDLGSAQWPLVKAALLHAEGKHDPLPTHSSINTYPMLDGRFVNLEGFDLRNGRVLFISTGGDTYGGTVWQMQGDKRTAEIRPPGPYGSYFGVSDYQFSSRTRRAQVACYRDENHAEQVCGPISTDLTERAAIDPGAEYHLGKCRGRLTTTGKVTVKPLRDYVTFFGNDRFRRSIWAGKDSEFPFDVNRSIVLDARGPLYARWILISEKGGTWECLRPSV
jgi:hypothetical protein